jgi:PAS domain S-box-containing protein
MSDVSEDRFARTAMRELDLVAAVGFPILCGSKIAGVITLFSRHPLLFDRSMLELMEGVGRSIGEFLRRTESFREVAESIPHLVWTARADGVNEYFNRRSLSFFDRSLEELTHADAWLDSVHPDDRLDAERAWRRATARGEDYCFDVRLRRAADGEYVWHQIHAVPMEEDGRILRWIGTCTNIHERKLAEAGLKQAHQQKDQFLAMLGHELRNPLAAIRSAYELLRLKLGDEPRVQRVYGILDRQTSHMVKLIDGLLDVSRIVRGKVTLEREIVELGPILLNVVSDASQQIVSADLRVQVAVPDPLWVDADPVRLAQIFDNLLANAIKFSRPGGSIRVSARRRDATAVVIFSDDGIGIEPSMLVNIFEPFQQATPTLDRSPGGLGLGLALVKGLVELLGGTVVARSEGPGSGSEFELVLPLADQLRAPMAK